MKLFVMKLFVMKFLRRTVNCALGALLLALALAAPARALEIHEPYSPAVFAAAQAAGAPILLHVRADWCPTCQAQDKVLGELRARPALARLRIMEVDFDHDKAALQRFGVRTQSTMILFLGDKEVVRAIGETRGPAIESLVARLLPTG